MNANTTERDTHGLNREGDQMNTETTKRDIAMLRSLARMPFLDRTELAATSGIAYRSAHYAVAALEERRLVEAVPHASRLIASTHRFCVTPDGVLEMARLDGVAPGDALKEYPISAHWQADTFGETRRRGRDLQGLRPPSHWWRVPEAVIRRSGASGIDPCRWTRLSPSPTVEPSASSGRVPPRTGRPSANASGVCSTRRASRRAGRCRERFS